MIRVKEGSVKLGMLIFIDIGVYSRGLEEVLTASRRLLGMGDQAMHGSRLRIFHVE